MVNVDVCLNKLICSANVPLPYISNAAFICTMNALSKAECVVIQPVMKLEVHIFLFVSRIIAYNSLKFVNITMFYLNDSRFDCHRNILPECIRT
jgi:hypothetical protein